MGGAKIQSGIGRSRRIVEAIRVRAAWCFTFLYLFLSLVAPLHSHSAGDSVSGSVVACAAHGESPADTAAGEEPVAPVLDRPASPLPAISALHCPVCDLLAQPVTAGSVPPAVLAPIAQTAIPAPPECAVSYKPFRFCDRSASRAPPASSSLLA